MFLNRSITALIAPILELKLQTNDWSVCFHMGNICQRKKNKTPRVRKKFKKTKGSFVNKTKHLQGTIQPSAAPPIKNYPLQGGPPYVGLAWLWVQTQRRLRVLTCVRQAKGEKPERGGKKEKGGSGGISKDKPWEQTSRRAIPRQAELLLQSISQKFQEPKPPYLRIPMRGT